MLARDVSGLVSFFSLRAVNTLMSVYRQSLEHQGCSQNKGQESVGV